jgi:nucleotide-binding universal stress UspA family protein
MISRILVPVQPSSPSKVAIDLAALSAKAFGASLLLTTVVSEDGAGHNSDLAPDGGDDITTGTAFRRQAGGSPTHDTGAHPGHAVTVAEQQLQSLARELREEIGTVDVAVASGDPIDNLIEMAHRESVDLVVMATHGRRGIARGIMGSVADAMVRNSAIPVLVVKGD